MNNKLKYEVSGSKTIKMRSVLFFLFCALFLAGCATLDRKLVSADDGQRQVALEKLTKLDFMEKEKLIKPLVSYMKADYWEVRSRAADALGLIMDKSVIEALAKALKDPDKEVRISAARSLGSLRAESAVANLIEACIDKECEVRRNAVVSLGLIGDNESIDTIILTLKDSNDKTREDAIWAITSFGIKGIEPLVSLLEHENWYSRWLAEISLINMGEPAAKYIVSVFSQKSWFTRWRMAGILQAIKGKEAAASLVDLSTIGTSEEIKTKATDALGIVNNQKAVEYLIKYTKHTDPNIRMRAVEYMGYSASKFAAKDIVPLLKDDNILVVEKAALSLVNLNWEPETLENKVDFYVLTENWVELNKLGSNVIKLVVKKLYDKDDIIRIKAARGLGEMKSRIAVKGLLENMSSPNPKLRLAVVEALSKMEDIDLSNQIIGALGDADESVVLKSMQILGQRKERRAAERLSDLIDSKNERIRNESSNMLVSLGKLALRAVTSKLRDKNVDMSAAAVKILEQMDFLEAKEILDRFKTGNLREQKIQTSKEGSNTKIEKKKEEQVKPKQEESKKPDEQKKLNEPDKTTKEKSAVPENSKVQEEKK
jgi:HEAT repeat protein